MPARCLIVEDQALVAMSLEAYLEEAGIEVTATFPSNTKALKWLDAHTPELALVDVMLADGPCVKLARELKNRGIPFVIYSGLPPARDCPPELREVPWLEKPVERAALTSALVQLLASGMRVWN
jgi:DNA-binding NtrC family response regulator